MDVNNKLTDSLIDRYESLSLDHQIQITSYYITIIYLYYIVSNYYIINLEMSLLYKKAVFTNRTINTSNNLRNDVIDVDNINLFK